MRVMASGVEHPSPLLALSFPLGFLPRAGRLGYNHLRAASPPPPPLPAELPYLLTLLYFAPGAFPPGSLALLLIAHRLGPVGR